MSNSRKSAAMLLPHSWTANTWPDFVWPHTTSRARYIIRTHRDELVKFGALVRVQRDLIVIGARYGVWLESRGYRVESYEIPPARHRGAA